MKILCANVDPDNTDVQIIDFQVEVADIASVILTSDPHEHYLHNKCNEYKHLKSV